MASTTLSFSSSSSIFPFPKPNPIAQDPNFGVTHYSTSAPPSKSASTSSNESEFLSFSQTTFSGTNRKTNVKKKKKKNNNNKNNAMVVAHTLPQVFTYCIHNKRWLKALQLFDMLREQPYYEPKEKTYMKLIVLLGKSGQPHHAHQLFNAMKEDGCESTQLYTALLAAYCRNSLIDEAFSTLDEMKHLPRCQPDVVTYNTLIKACVDALKIEQVELLYEEMAERSIVPETATHNIVLSGYGKAGWFDKMEKMLSSMTESTKCKPDILTMHTVISVFGNKGRLDLMEKWYDKFCDFGIQPETRTFNILIGAYGKKGMYENMSSVMESMRKLHCPWTTSTYNNLIEVFAAVGDARSMEYTFDQMCGDGMKVDTKTFCCLINGYANAGIFHKVNSVVQLAGRFQIPENTSFYNAVISACAKAEDLIEMERIFKRMKEKRCQPDETTYSILVEAYRKEGMDDKIYYLEQEIRITITGEKEF
ncbi:unnamed protein product [Lupinus luteus]|uniref:Pentatricopeptide repeat-containing protein n=1 Tax=Lupinus luteus TaxID=3873 RepID=A0AAV1W6G2_LUPLU